jgi:hypothetical protein
LQEPAADHPAPLFMRLVVVSSSACARLNAQFLSLNYIDYVLIDHLSRS